MATDTIAPKPRETITPIVGDYIVSTPGTASGEPRIAGSRIKVRHVYTWVEVMGMTVPQVLEQYPHLTRAAIHAALAYYWSHQDEIHRAIAEADQLVEEMKAKAGPSPLTEKLAAKGLWNGSNDSIPSR